MFSLKKKKQKKKYQKKKNLSTMVYGHFPLGAFYKK